MKQKYVIRFGDTNCFLNPQLQLTTRLSSAMTFQNKAWAKRIAYNCDVFPSCGILYVVKRDDTTFVISIVRRKK